MAIKVQTWQARMASADKRYEEWEEEFQCDQLEEYYYNNQHKDKPVSQDLYTINLFFPTIEIRLPRLLFTRPKVRIKPRPAKEDDPMSEWDKRVTLLENTANTLVSSRAVNFVEANKTALRESFFRFGIVEYGYSADSADNPNVGKPVLSHDDKEMKDKEGNLITEPEKVLMSETVYARRIPAKQFRVPPIQKMRLIENSWCAYYEWMYPEDIKAQKSWENTAQIKTTGKMDPKYVPRTDSDDDEDEQKAGLVKVWKVWDFRGMKRYVFPEEGKKFFVDGVEFSVNPFVDYRFHQILDQFYPMPPTHPWLSPQDELNETRNQQRTHRRRFNRKYTVLPGRIKPEELQKLESGEDGVYANVSGHDAIQAVEDAPLDRAVYANAPATKEDFMMISNVGGEQRGVSESDTATQANIIQANMDIREGSAREIVSQALGDGIFAMLQILRTSSSLPFMIEVGIDKQSPMSIQAAQDLAFTWKQIQSEDLGGFDFDVEIDVSSMAPINEDKQKQDWIQTLGLFGNSTLMMVMTASDTILRKTLALQGIKGDKDVKEIRDAMIRVLQAQQMQAEQALKAKAGLPPDAGGPPAPGGVASPGPTPDNGDIKGQLIKQMPS